MGEDRINKVDLARLIEALRTLSEGMGEGATVDRVLALLNVSYHTQVNGYVDQNELASLVSVSPSTMSRNVAALSDIGDRGRTPLQMIAVRLDPTDRRRRLVTTTPKGEALLKKALSGSGLRGHRT
jgi:DNA-binding MarR family transcriptional regulator